MSPTFPVRTALLGLTALLLPAAGHAQCDAERLEELRGAGVSEQEIEDLCPNEAGDSPPSSQSRAEIFKEMYQESQNPEAAFKLGQLYERGEGVIQDFVQAYAWYARALAREDREKYKIALDNIESQMPPRAVAEAQRLNEKKPAEEQDLEPGQTGQDPILKLLSDHDIKSLDSKKEAVIDESSELFSEDDCLWGRNDANFSGGHTIVTHRICDGRVDRIYIELSSVTLKNLKSYKTFDELEPWNEELSICKNKLKQYEQKITEEILLAPKKLKSYQYEISFGKDMNLLYEYRSSSDIYLHLYGHVSKPGVDSRVYTHNRSEVTCIVVAAISLQDFIK